MCNSKKGTSSLLINQMSLPGENQPINNDVLEGWFAKQRSGQHQQGVEPL